MKVLVTGAAGFAGSHCLEYLSSLSEVKELHGTSLGKSLDNALLGAIPQLTAHVCDATNKEQVFDLIATVKPDVVIHLAAQSYVSSSWENPELTLHTNIIGQSNLLEAIRTIRGSNYDPTVVIACSSEEYGPRGADEPPLTEQSDLRPQSPYALSKVGQDFMGLQYWLAYQLKVVRLRVFNHTGPRRDPVFGVSGFCKKVVEIERGLREPKLEIRDLSAVRDFTDVRDIVRAYWLAANRCNPGDVYNVCSGRGYSFSQILDAITSQSVIKNIALVKDPAGARPTDGGRVVGDNSKFKHATGWEPSMDLLTRTVPDLLAYWRGRSND